MANRHPPERVISEPLGEAKMRCVVRSGLARPSATTADCHLGYALPANQPCDTQPKQCHALFLALFSTGLAQPNSWDTAADPL
jgi:hypothetical protein